MMPPKEMHKIQMMYAIYEDGTKEPIVIDEITDAMKGMVKR